MADVIDEKLLMDIKDNLEYYIRPLSIPDEPIDINLLRHEHEIMRKESKRIVSIIKNSLNL